MSASMPESALSIVIPVRNDARNLAICLAALRGADVQPLEMIVVDDASTEDVSSIVSKTTARYLQLPKQVGAGAARNAGWRIAQGEIVLFVDSDVVFPSDASRRVLERLREILTLWACSVPMMIHLLSRRSTRNSAISSITTFTKTRTKTLIHFGLVLAPFAKALWRARVGSTSRWWEWKIWN